LLEESPRPTAPLPGKPIDLDKTEEAARNEISREAREARVFLFKDRVQRAESYLFLGKTSCGECHTYEPETGGTRKVAAPGVKGVWFEHARFNHAAHRAVDCRACHAGAYTSGSAEDVLVPGIENCKQCHSPRKQGAGGPVGGVRHDCVECHSYHHGDRPLQGPGAAARDPKQKMDVPAFLRGARD
jgi:Class III cytochrome C family